MKLGEAMYHQSQRRASRRAAEQRAARPDDGVVDADFEEVKDDDRKSA